MIDNSSRTDSYLERSQVELNLFIKLAESLPRPKLITEEGEIALATSSHFDSRKMDISSPDQLIGILNGFRGSRQSAVTLDSEILRTYDLRKATAAIWMDLSSMASVSTDVNRKLAFAGPGARYSSILSEAQKNGLTVDFEPVLGIDFTMGDWAHESLRMFSTTTMGLDGVLRNVKVMAPTRGFQTGFDTTPANGGGYDLTKLFMSSGAVLGVPYEFSIPLRPLPEKTAEKTYVFDSVEAAIKAAIEIDRSGFAKTIQLQSGGLIDVLQEGRKKSSRSKENNLIVKIEGGQSLLDTAQGALDDIAQKMKGKVRDAMVEIAAPALIDPSSFNGGAYLLGICACDTHAVSSLIDRISKMASREKKSAHYCLADITQSGCLMVPILFGERADELLKPIASLLTDARISLRGNSDWNPVLGDSRAPARIELVRRIKQFLDPEMILNPHVLNGMAEGS